MEDLIKLFMAIEPMSYGSSSSSGYGSSSGDGSGDGYGYGYGSGSGDGYGYGYGSGDGSGDGYGYGSGSGDGYGYGDGSGDGDGYGYGSGDGDGDGSGDGYGYGDGSGDGDGSGSGDGYGYGYGSGDGDGYGSGSGDGDGDGYGYGSGSGDGDGSGSGSGSGSGYGSGDGYGYGSGSGDGDGYGYVKTINYTEYKKGFLNKQIHSFKSFNKKPVYYIDDIPCIFLSIVGNVAKVDVIKDDMSTKRMYIAKSGNIFAHGETKEKAIQSVNDKLFASLSFEAKKAEFIKLFKKDGTYPNRHFFDWHHHLTGSCESGRMMFVRAHGIDLDAGMNTITFLNLTKNEYNGRVIKEILEELL